MPFVRDVKICFISYKIKLDGVYTPSDFMAVVMGLVQNETNETQYSPFVYQWTKYIYSCIVYIQCTGC